MDKALYTAMTGARATLRAQAAVSHNLANIDTTGFKAEMVATQPFQVPGVGLASRIDATQSKNLMDESGGAPQLTGNPLDVAFDNGVWLGVQGVGGEEVYTRAGNLQLSPNGQLLTARGEPVLGENGPISIPPHAAIEIGGDGTVSIQPLGQGPETQAIIGKLKLGQAAPGVLTRGEEGRMRAPTPLPPATGNVVKNGMVEGSNVEGSTALVQMIELSRQFELQVKVLKTAEENGRASASLLRMS